MRSTIDRSVTNPETISRLFIHYPITTWRDTVPGEDQRKRGDDDGDTGADVKHCRTEVSPDLFTDDTCPRAGGLNQNTYGDATP
jgi:hypothetical protein